MYCSNCGNKVDEDAYVCLNCGVILKKRENKVKSKKNNIKLFNVVTLVFSIISFILSFSLFFYDISEVGMYTKAYERIIYGLGFVSTTMFFTIISLIFALVNKKSNIGKIGLGLTLISIFLILTEIFVIVIY